MKLSIIIPVYNEEKNIEKVIKAVRQAPITMDKEIIIVDDGSVDQTKQLINRYSLDSEIKICFQAKNQGKGAAIRKGLKISTGDIILIQDADMEYTVDDYPTILEPFIKENAKVVFGSRFKGEITGMRWPNFVANKILTFTANLLYGTHISDEATAYKAFRSEVIKKIPLKCQRFEFCPEVTAKVAKRGYEIVDVPIRYHGRSIKDGKKITWRDGMQAIWVLIKYRFID
ncbi:TPA: glycosyltransferase family 2 protein [Candidatus Berkelbacteria bacterium]|uniref:Glycosyl transferase family 2 n=1 Tax=Berkelbacteria bacterium GW2011_GWE1_39_12 TaxID=1618337 RepID=A0A0G4B2I1_9BACT|nr:MAG: glycosyl transferase family 2 [Berkelbacteria bacterium GW2011_GWE1_39_12]HBO60749.1 glycosyltransferase family 2 protein [Candidatus Berkelbacteria bacterium]